MKNAITSLLVALASFTPLVAQGGFLGVSMQEDDKPGALVQEVVIPSAAEIMGLKAGDHILEVNGVQTLTNQMLSTTVSAILPGEIVELLIIRGDRKLNIRGVLGRRPQTDTPLIPQLNKLNGSHFFDSLQDLEAHNFFGSPLNLDDIQGLEDMLMPLGQVEDLWDIGDINILGAGDSEVSITYPESTPMEERESLIGEAIEKYGKEVKVEFHGNRHMIQMRTSTSKGGSPFGSEQEWNLEDLLNHAQVERNPQKKEVSVKKALAFGKPVLLDFSAEWCKPCKMLSSEVLKNPKYSELLDQFTLLEVDIDQNPRLAEEFGVSGIPDIRVLNIDGSELGKKVGYTGAKGTLGWLKSQLAEALPAKKSVDSEKAEIKNLLEQELKELHEEIRILREELNNSPR